MVKVSFETTECSRCGGCGRYSWCQRYGDTCFKCGGTGRQLSRRGAAAYKRSEAWKAEHRTYKAVADLVAGDRIVVDGRTNTVTAVAPSSTTCTANGVTHTYVNVTLARNLRPVACGDMVLGGGNEIGYPADKRIALALNDEQREAYVAYIRKYKGVTVTEEEARS